MREFVESGTRIVQLDVETVVGYPAFLIVFDAPLQLDKSECTFLEQLCTIRICTSLIHIDEILLYISYSNI